MQHKLTIEGTGPATFGTCSCGCWAELCSFTTRNRRAFIREAHQEHLRLAEEAGKFAAAAASPLPL